MKLADGSMIDSSLERGGPISFPVSSVIPGFVEALLLMNVGDKFEIALPPKLAYGAKGTESIKPNSVLIFEIELFKISDK